tara:strand:- start:16580 stop:17200 length:621 start_codon:yes stop_codon:yes gene_type:complete
MRKIKMNNKLKLIFIFFFIALSSSTQADYKISSAEDYVSLIAQETINILGNKEQNIEDKINNISNIFLSNLAVREISLFVLGPYRRNLTTNQTEEYINLIKRFVSEIYSIRLASFPNGAFTIVNATDNGRSGIIVKTLIQFEGNKNPTKIDWRIIKNQNNEFKVFDIRVIGVWMAQEQRSTFTSFLSKNNGDVNKLMFKLKEQLNN